LSILALFDEELKLIHEVLEISGAKSRSAIMPMWSAVIAAQFRIT
jgi:hypothetical protein